MDRNDIPDIDTLQEVFVRSGKFWAAQLFFCKIF
jgi:hypothetical protein